MEEKHLFEKFLKRKNLKHSQTREWVLDVFLQIERHITSEELWVAVKQKYPSVGIATVYRTLQLLCESGLSREIHFNDGKTRYEHLYGHEHHDHLICTQCGMYVEVLDNKIERLQVELMKRNGFIPQHHRMDLYGICTKCKK